MSDILGGVGEKKIKHGTALPPKEAGFWDPWIIDIGLVTTTLRTHIYIHMCVPQRKPCTKKGDGLFDFPEILLLCRIGAGVTFECWIISGSVIW